MDMAPVAKSNARAEQTARRLHDEFNLLYKQPAWCGKRGLSIVMRRLNPVCQRIPNTGQGAGLYAVGEQCHQPSAMCHHIISPRVRPDLFLDPRNLICFCDQCHPTTEGNPASWVLGKDWVPTILPAWRVGQ
jgi:hypothetical protein